MELVYLWVEDYKNIYHQGFNFSPRFTCKYEDGELTIDKKEHVSIFPENINVTAIVGENGSGKSSIVEYIEKIILEEDIKDYIYLFLIDEVIHINTNIKSKLNVIILDTQIQYIFDNVHHFSLCTYYAEMPYPYEYRKKLHSQDKIFTVNLQEKNVYKAIASLLKRAENKVLENLDFIFKPTTINVDENIQYKNDLIYGISSEQKEDLSFSNYVIKDASLKELFAPNKSKLLDKLIDELFDNDGRYDNFLESKADEEFKKNKKIYKENWKEDDGFSMSDEDIKQEISSQFVDKYPSEQYISETLNKDELYQFFLQSLNWKFFALFDIRPSLSYKNKKKLVTEIDLFKIFLFYQIVKNNLLEKYFEFVISNYLKYYTAVETLKDLVEKTFEDSEINKIESFLYDSKIDVQINYKEYKKLKKSNINQSDINEYFGDYYDFFTFDFLDINKRKFSYLSYGEKTFYGLVINIYTYILKNNEKNNLLLYFDEPELSLHPKWQKEFLNKLFFILKNITNNIHLIFTSHSPFLLSDLPKENVIFLEKYKTDEDKNQKEGNCKNVTSEINIETFGANIHTLLSHGFFMKDGLMGEFAKGKIRTIQVAYKYILHRNKQKSLNKKEHKKSRRFIRTQLKKLWYIQSIIGENFLQTIMKNYLQEIEQILLGNDKAIDNEIERLQNLKKSIKNASN